MDHVLIQRVVEELRTTLTGRFFGKIFQLGPLTFALDFGLRGEYLFISVDPSNPRFYLIKRRLKELERQSIPLNSFGLTMRSKGSFEMLTRCAPPSFERIIWANEVREIDCFSSSLRRRLIK